MKIPNRNKFGIFYFIAMKTIMVCEDWECVNIIIKRHKELALAQYLEIGH